MHRAQIFAYAGGDRYAVTNQANFYNRDVPAGDQFYRAFVQTDRPLYRPQQTIYFRIVMTQGLPGKYRPAAATQARLQITGPRGTLLDKTVTMDGSGAVNDSLTLPPGADLGDYQILVFEPANSTNGWLHGKADFRVEEYKKPEFAITVQPQKSQVRVGEEMKVTIGARYFFGAPVAHAKVHYLVSRTPFLLTALFRPQPDWFDPDYSGRDDGPNVNYGHNILTGNPDYSAWGTGDNLYREGDLTTDANGEAILSFPTDPPKGFRSASNAPPDQDFTIVADVVDDSRRQERGVGTAHAIATQFRAFMQIDRRFVLPGDPLKIEINTRDGSQQPVSADGEIKLVRLIPAVPEQRGIDRRTGKEIILVKYVPPREEEAGTLGAHTDVAQDGSGFAYWRPDTPGDYRLDYQAKDAWGNLITASATILVYGPSFDARLNKDDQRFDITAEFANYRRGETARVLIVTPVPDSYVLFTEQAVGGIVRYRTLFVPGRSTLVDVPITLDHVPNSQFEATLVRDGQVREAQTEIGVPEEEQILTLKVTPDKPTYKPGERATFALHATDANGKPVRGAISLAVVDKSLLALQSDLMPDIRHFFYGYRIQTSISGADSVGFSPGNADYGPPQTHYESHLLVFPEGMSWLEDHSNENQPMYVPDFVPYQPPSAGDAVFTRSNSMTGVVGDGFGGGMGRFGGGFGSNDLTREPIQRQLGTTSSAAGAAASLSPEGVRDIFGYEPDSSISVRGMPEAAPMAKAAPPSLAEATVRRLFADTATWVPAVLTDADGNATVSFDFPDNITQWQVMARGVTGTIQVGMAEAEAITKKNLLVRLQAPRFFVDRDQVTISANIHNYLDSDKTARVELVVDGQRLVLADLTPQPPSLAARTIKPVRTREGGDTRWFGETAALPPVSLAAKSYNVNACLPSPFRRGVGGEVIKDMRDGATNLPLARTDQVTPFPSEERAAREGGRGVRQIIIAKDGEVRMDWTVRVQQAGRTKIKIVAQTDQESDAAEMEFPVLVHGVEKFLAQTGVLRNGGEASWTFDLPEMRRQGATLLDVQMAPSLASIMLDALPYLEDYPYGCVEQTLSRFVPSVLVAKTLRDSGLDLETLGKRAQALAEQRKNIPPQQIFADSGYTYPKGVPGALDAQELAQRLAESYHGRADAPIFDSAALKPMVDAGLQRLESMQLSDGGWGWWSGSDASDPYLTAYIVEGLLHAQQADVAVKPEVIENGYTYLRNHLDSTEDLHLLAYYVYVLSLRDPKANDAPGRKMAEEFLYTRRDRLNAYGLALLALALHDYGDDEKARVLVDNLVNTAQQDAERGTAHWENRDERFYWRWYNDKQETTAMALRALVSGDIIEVELSLKSDNDYDYVVFEDMKPAGCEALETRSGEAYGDGLCSNFELRDEKVVFFVDTLPQGTRRITYRLRAEIPGAFHALPTNAYAMYTPDIRALSDEWRVSITDQLPTRGKPEPAAKR